MNLYILDNKKLEKYTLPKNIDEDYAIDYKPYNSTSKFLISLEVDELLQNVIICVKGIRKQMMLQ